MADVDRKEQDIRNEVIEDVQKDEEENIALPEPLALHPLKHKWTYWYLNDDRQASWEDRLKPVCTFSTVEEFWALYNNIRPPSGLNCLCDYSVFKSGIPPMWEVPENLKGGRWLINIEKGRPGEIMDLIWLEILIAMIGEQFGDDMDLICGLVCNVRGKGSKISMWTKDSNAEEGNIRIGQVLKQKLLGAEVPPGCTTPLFDILKYEDHDSCQKKCGSTVKAKLSISAVNQMPERN
ncbi:hypothetical protein Angca_006275 [Angiostrongylus cantonensis]|nr:hypothetical protein Angca_006275 [Angiostrongylus cantonensis]